MIKINEDERRDFFRIVDDVHLNIKAITEDEYSSAADTLETLHESSFSLSADFATLNNNISPLLSNIKQLHPEIAEFLHTLNDKIDSLSQLMLYKDNVQEKIPTIQTNISASGMQFHSEEIFKIQQAVKLELVLLPEKIGILIFGRIINSTQKTTSVIFEFLRPEDRELMIKHNLTKQMADLRERNDNN